jgi:hypothetical protein
VTSQLSLMVTPTKLTPTAADDSAEGPPQFYVLRNTGWRDVPLAARPIGRPSEVKDSIEKKLTAIMSAPLTEAQGALGALAGQFFQVWSKWIPESIQRELDQLPRAADDPPCVSLYIHPSLEWIPWELMHDGTDFLGVRYVIARLPIVRRGPAAVSAQRHVSRICTFLGEHVMDDAEQTEWEGTFSGLPNGTTVERFPENGVWPTADTVTQAAKADILHITCHGGIQDAVLETVWTLNHQGLPFTYGIGQAGVDQMAFADEGPLVFGNACQSTAGAVTSAGLTPGLAYSFFDKGAAAFVGTFAPITKTMALKFATAFYGYLLGQGQGVGTALWRTKSDFGAAGEADPSWLFYCLYGAPQTQFVVS